MTQDLARLQDLIRRASCGEESAFRELVEEHQHYVFALAFRLVWNHDDAEDIVQETFIKVWNHLASYDPSVKFTTWVYKIAVNLSYDRLKGRQRRHRWFPSVSTLTQDPPVHEPREEENITNRQLAQQVRTIADHLPTKQRLVFLLRDVQDMSVEEVAHILSMSTGSVKTNLSYARRAIRLKLDQLRVAEEQRS